MKSYCENTVFAVWVTVHSSQSLYSEILPVLLIPNFLLCGHFLRVIYSIWLSLFALRDSLFCGLLKQVFYIQPSFPSVTYTGTKIISKSQESEILNLIRFPFYSAVLSHIIQQKETTDIKEIPFYSTPHWIFGI